MSRNTSAGETFPNGDRKKEEIEKERGRERGGGYSFINLCNCINARISQFNISFKTYNVLTTWKITREIQDNFVQFSNRHIFSDLFKFRSRSES